MSAKMLLTPAQRRRRLAAVTLLYRQGYTFEKIGPALGISSSTAHDDAIELGLIRGRRSTKTLRRDTPEPIDWRSEPSPTSPSPLPLASCPAAYQTSPVIADAAHWVEGFNGGDHPNRLAHNLAEAEAIGDTAWLAYARDLIENVHEQSGRLLRVLNDPAYRDRCRRGTDLEVRTVAADTPRLRAV